MIKGYKDFKDCSSWTKTSLVSLAGVLSRHTTLLPNAKETKISLDIIVYIAPKHLSVQMGDTLTVKGRGGGGL